MRFARLKQPLFTKEGGEAYHTACADKLLLRLVQAYDTVWTQLYEPADITAADREANAKAALNNIGQILEHVLGTEAFEDDPAQL